MATWAVGVDLGKKGAHIAVLADESGQQIGPVLSFFTSPDELDRVRAELEARAPEGSEIVLVVDPTPMWRPVARYLKACCHRVFLANQSQAYSLRKLLKRHANTDCLDALTLAKLPLVCPKPSTRFPCRMTPAESAAPGGQEGVQAVPPHCQPAVLLAVAPVAACMTSNKQMRKLARPNHYIRLTKPHQPFATPPRFIDTRATTPARWRGKRPLGLCHTAFQSRLRPGDRWWSSPRLPMPTRKILSVPSTSG